MMPFHPLARRDRVPAAELADASYGLFIVSGSPLMAEACASRGPDWLVLDMEASDAGRRELTQMLQALNGAHAFGIARVPSNTRQQIEAALDAGAHGLIVPKVSSAAEARAVVDAAFYPPKGTRGLNPIRSSAFFTDMADYFAHANARVLVGVQIETAEALRNLPEIAAVNGIDLLFVGCGDLAAELGHMGDVDHADVHAATAAVLEACRAAGKIPGIFAYSSALARRYRNMGYSFIAIGNEVKLMLGAIEEGLAAVRT